MITNSGASTSLSPWTTTEYVPPRVPRPSTRLRSSAPDACSVHRLALGAIDLTYAGQSGVPIFAQPDNWATALRRAAVATPATKLPAASFRYMSSVTSYKTASGLPASAGRGPTISTNSRNMSPRRLQVTALFQQILVIALSPRRRIEGLSSYSRQEIQQARDQRLLILKVLI